MEETKQSRSWSRRRSAGTKTMPGPLFLASSTHILDLEHTEARWTNSLGGIDEWIYTGSSAPISLPGLGGRHESDLGIASGSAGTLGLKRPCRHADRPKGWCT